MKYIFRNPGFLWMSLGCEVKPNSPKAYNAKHVKFKSGTEHGSIEKSSNYLNKNTKKQSVST